LTFELSKARYVGRHIGLCALAAALLTACAPVAPAHRPPPLRASGTDDWQYGVYLLSIENDPVGARTYLQRAETDGDAQALVPGSLFYRDLAEAALFGGDAPAAAAAAQTGREALARQPTTAQFQPADRSLFERDLEALAAAAAGDVDLLSRIALSDGAPPDADPWYLLAWTQERAGNASAAADAARHYLQLAPAWSFLRGSASMRENARRLAQ
jgi:hypothetical protein